ncbi:MAG: hypothetical protein CL933_18550 [Deltaproteobacteria bacterium]|nr:hypothetical protein [Deltaproteobacteria bacterium]
MFSSAFSTESPRHAAREASREGSDRLVSRFERGVARVLVVALIAMTPANAFASDAFPSADDAVMLTDGVIDQTLPGETTITSFVENGQTLWTGGLDLPSDHTLNFDLVSDGSTHWNHVGGDFSAHINGHVVSGPNNTIVFASPFGVFVDSEAILDVGTLVAVGADVLNHDLQRDGPALMLTGPVENQGLMRATADILLYGTSVRNRGEILAPDGNILLLGAEAIHFPDLESIAESLINPVNFLVASGDGTVDNDGRLESQNAALLGSRVANHGEIEIADGSLMMIGADAIYVSQFDNPVLFRLPHATAQARADSDDPEYRVANHGQINAGLGHVRLAASDPLGWGIRQGTGTTGTSSEQPTIVARKIEIEGGEEGRVELSGHLDATGRGEGEVGGEIDITGGYIVVADATIDASGDSGGGTIQIGGEEQGKGALRRARALLMDQTSEVHADALRDGDGGRVILFSEDLTLIEGGISARGGAEAGNGGFIETSGLANFQITQSPDASAPNGEGGDWLIDPYAISIVAALTDSTCADTSGNCLEHALEVILAPNFDSAAFDDVLRTVAPPMMGQNPNQLSVDLLTRALTSGMNITLSTEAFDPEATPGIYSGEEDLPAGGRGDITVDAPIVISDSDSLPGTTARLTLLAAGSIFVNEDISVGSGSSALTPNQSLALEFRANDQAQRDANQAFGTDQLRGSVNIDANIRTGGGQLIASGVSVSQSAASTIETDGGTVDLIAGSLNTSHGSEILTRDGTETEIDATTGAPIIDPMTGEPAIIAITTTADASLRIAGTIDTTRPDDDPDTGGEIRLIANGLLVSTVAAGNDRLSIDTGLVELTGTLMSGGGDIAIAAGIPDSTFAGSVEITNGSILSEGGNVSIDAHRVDALADHGAFDITFVEVGTRGEGGEITATGAITTGGGTLAIGSATTQQISLDGTFDTTGGDTGEDGLISIVAHDASGVIAEMDLYGQGQISIGTHAATTLASAGIRISSREITTAENNDLVTITASGTTTATILESNLGIDSDPNDPSDLSSASEGEVRFDASRQIAFNANTRIEGDRVRINVAPDPSLLGDVEEAEIAAMLPDERDTRLTFHGSGGMIASNGVRLQSDDLSISIGDGTTVNANLEFEETEDPVGSGIPNAFGYSRRTRGNYAGLQLRDQDGTERPEVLSIRQDGDLLIGGTAPLPTTPGEIFFGQKAGTGGTTGAFADALIGDRGQRITLESSDGTLTVEDAAGLSNDIAIDPNLIATRTNDNGLSWVVLNGGFLLPPPVDPDPESIIFSGGFLGDSAFDVFGLTLSTPQNLTVTTEMADAISFAQDLVFQAGRNTDVDGAADSGTLTVADGVDLQSSDRLALQAGASGFGDLVFLGSMTTTLAANDLELRAGAGRDSLNTDAATRSKITGVQNVQIREAGGADFVSTGATGLSFEFRQDAAIDDLGLLPTFANFSAGTITSFDGVGAATPVSYALRSDFGTINLRSTTEAVGDRFRDTALSLIGLQGVDAALQVSDDFSFVGPSIELGGVGDFTFSDTLAQRFNPTGLPAEARERVTLRAAMNGLGTLSFGSGATVTAPRIELIASDGIGNDSSGRILVGGASFDLSPVGSVTDRIFVYQEDDDIQVIDLPTEAQFIGNLPDLLPNILAIRSDGGSIDITQFEIASLDPGSGDRISPLPINPDVQTRLILEANTIELLTIDGGDLTLTPTEALDDPLREIKLRIRANELTLGALLPAVGTGRVLLGGLDADAPPAGLQIDSAYDAESLLIEAFDATNEIATTTNLSTASQTDGVSGMFDLTTGRGPTTLIIDQEGQVTPDELPDRFAISGNLRRSIEDERDGTAIPTAYTIISRQESAEVAPDNVSGSNLLLGSAYAPLLGDILFGAGGAGDLYEFANVGAYTTESITVADGVTMNSEDSIILAAALVDGLPTTAYTPTAAMGNLVFEGIASTTLMANRIELSAGPVETVTNPDVDNEDMTGTPDGKRDEIVQGALAQVDLRGLASVTRSGNSETSLFSVQQSRDFDLSTPGAEGDILTPLTAAGVPRPDEWNTLDLSSIQGELTVVTPHLISPWTDHLILGRIAENAKVIVDTTFADPFAASSPQGFDGQVRIESNDVTFRTSVAGELFLDAPNLRLVGGTVLTGLEFPEHLARLRSDPDAIERPIVRVLQPGDFSSTRLVRADRYLRRDFSFFTGEKSETLRESLSQIDIELTTTGNDFVLGDSVRAGTSFSNLIVRTNGGVADPNGNILIQLTGLTPGYTFDDFAAPDLDATDFAALQLASLDLEAGGGAGKITITPFSATGGPPMIPTADDLTIETSGDQRYSGETVLEETLSTNGRSIRFTDDIYRDSSVSMETDAGLILQARGEIFFEEDIGTSTDFDLSDVREPLIPDEQLGRLWVLFDSDSTASDATVQFGRRVDSSDDPMVEGDGDGVQETAIDSDQLVRVDGETVFLAAALNEPDDPANADDGNFLTDLRNDLGSAPDLGTASTGIVAVLAEYGTGRVDLVPHATIGKSSGNLEFESLMGGPFVMGSGERLSVGGRITIDHPGAVVTLGDVSALEFIIGGMAPPSEIGLMKRNAGTTFGPRGTSTQDGGSTILANMIDFGGVTPTAEGIGKEPRFGVVDPFDPTLPTFLGRFPVLAILPSGGLIDESYFSFVGTGIDDRVPSLLGLGSSRSQLPGAFGPTVVPTPSRKFREASPLSNADRLTSLAIDAHDTPAEVLLARLEGVAVIDDLAHSKDSSAKRGKVAITGARLDPQDAESAISLYEELFGTDGQRTGEVRDVLQSALDRYLEMTRARRVIGFELRRFVKNRPSSLLEAYTTLDQLDALFRYHRRLGLSPGEFRRIQRGWLEQIRPDGITLEELAEAIHPSRYVRGSDILDIFGR